MKKIARTSAISLLCTNKLTSLDIESRESYILDWWGIDDDDEEFSLLSEDIQAELIFNEDPPSDVANSKYNQLIIIGLAFEYRGVTNQYLSHDLSLMGMKDYEVFGSVEKLEICPCCEYRTLLSKGSYDVCGLCGWEDNGVDNPDVYSAPNHMTLAEAKRIFLSNISKLSLNKWEKS